jgi:hypothetical protein
MAMERQVGYHRHRGSTLLFIAIGKRKNGEREKTNESQSMSKQLDEMRANIFLSFRPLFLCPVIGGN